MDTEARDKSVTTVWFILALLDQVGNAELSIFQTTAALDVQFIVDKGLLVQIHPSITGSNGKLKHATFHDVSS